MPRVIFPKIVYTKPRFYNVLRSFIDSSLKDEYPWNTGVILPMTHNAIFTKEGRWVLNVCHDSAVLFTDNYEQVISYSYLDGRTFLSVDKNRYEEVDATVYVLADPPVKFQIPLAVSDIIRKLGVYREALNEAIPPNFLSCYGKCW